MSGCPLALWVKYEYDAANRLNIVRKDDTNQTQLERFQYDSTNARVQSHDFAQDRYKSHLNTGGTTIAEFTEFTVGVPKWTKSYTYMGGSQLATIVPDSGHTTEVVEFNHPDRLGTKTVTNQATGTSSEQAHLPFGMAMNAESSMTGNNKRFTSYDRSEKTKLDYAVNRTYDSKLGRFMQVDPIGVESASLAAPQTLNMYSYCGNDPINYTDSAGLFFGRLFKWIGKIFNVIKKILVWVVIVIALILVTAFILAYTPIALPGWLGNAMGSILGFLSKMGALAFGASLAGAIGVEVGVGIAGAIALGIFGAALNGVGAIASSYANDRKKKKKETPEQRRSRLIRSSIESALWRLRNKPRCKELVQKDSKHDAVTSLETLKSSNRVVYDSTINVPEQVSGEHLGKGPNSKIRLGGTWFEEGVGNWKGTMNAPRTRTNILLHGLKHAVEGKDHGPGEANDHYYKQIAKECFGINP